MGTACGNEQWVKWGGEHFPLFLGEGKWSTGYWWQQTQDTSEGTASLQAGLHLSSSWSSGSLEATITTALLASLHPLFHPRKGQTEPSLKACSGGQPHLDGWCGGNIELEGDDGSMGRGSRKIIANLYRFTLPMAREGYVYLVELVRQNEAVKKRRQTWVTCCLATNTATTKSKMSKGQRGIHSGAEINCREMNLN